MVLYRLSVVIHLQWILFFYFQFVEYLLSLPEVPVDKVREVFVRACTIHHPKKLSIHLKWAAFEESYGESSWIKLLSHCNWCSVSDIYAFLMPQEILKKPLKYWKNWKKNARTFLAWFWDASMLFADVTNTRRCVHCTNIISSRTKIKENLFLVYPLNTLVFAAK